MRRHPLDLISQKRESALEYLASMPLRDRRLDPGLHDPEMPSIDDMHEIRVIGLLDVEEVGVDLNRHLQVKMPDLPKGYYVLLLLLKDSRGGLLTGQLPYEVQ